MKTYRIIENIENKTCPTCKLKVEAREHAEITNTQLNKPFYFSKWYYCSNSDCRTKLVMDDQFKVRNAHHRRKMSRKEKQVKNDFRRYAESQEMERFWMKNM
jgi:hypothetical protein